MRLPNLAKAVGIGTVIAALTAGTAFAAVATSSVNVRSGPGTSYRVLDTLRPGEQVDIVGRSGGWCEVRKSGPDGWVSCNYLANDRYDRDRYRDRPSFGFSIGIGPDRPHRPMRPLPPRHWYDSGFYARGPNGSFGFSFNN
ncbi:MAG: SH3 domain-containing protein [Alphaproteobacteria bacterium]|jgi:uncharacterized protein YraI|nr:SH3 domain-containing protein [Alphaproteobacteria bacterium]